MNKKKVIVVEDDVNILEAMQFMLEDAGYDVMARTDGDFLKDLSSDLPDLLLLDIWLSGIDGTKICKHLKNNTRTKHIPILLCSANNNIKKLTKASGADDFIQKPFQMDDFLAKVKKHTQGNN